MGALPYYYEGFFIFTFLSLFTQFYIAIKQREEHKRIFAPYFWYFMGFYTPLYVFLSEMYPYSRFGFSENQAVFVLICSCIAIPLIHALVEAALMLTAHSFRNNGWDILGIASIWVVGEWVLSLGMLAFPWSGIAVSLTGCLPYLQTASLFGKYFITFITVAACYAFALAVKDRKKFFALCGAVTIGLNLLVGTVIWLIPVEKSDAVTVSALQGNVLSNEKWQSGNRGAIFETYVGMAEEAAENGAKIIILPETAIPQAFVPNGKIHSALAEISRKYEVVIISGVHYYDADMNYNAVIAVMPDGSLSERYDKRHLVPFGEFIPFADILGEMFPFVGEFNEGTSDLTEGTESVVIETNWGDFAPLVCFDSIFPEFARDGVNNGAEFIAVVTNDSWFNDSVGIYTHLRHAQLRAIENRRYILRAANTGISAFIDEKGHIVTQTEPITLDTATAQVYAIDSITLYTLAGDVFLYVSFFIVTGFIIYSIFDKARRNINGNNSTSSE